MFRHLILQFTVIYFFYSVDFLLKYSLSCFEPLVLVLIRFWWFSSCWFGPRRRCSRRPQTGTTRCSSVSRPAGSGPGRSGRRGLSSGRVRLCVPGLDWSRSCCCTRPPRGWTGSGSSPWTTWTNDSNRTDCFSWCLFKLWGDFIPDTTDLYFFTKSSFVKKTKLSDKRGVKNTIFQLPQICTSLPSGAHSSFHALANSVSVFSQCLNTHSCLFSSDFCYGLLISQNIIN